MEKLSDLPPVYVWPPCPSWCTVKHSADGVDKFMDPGTRRHASPESRDFPTASLVRFDDADDEVGPVELYVYDAAHDTPALTLDRAEVLAHLVLNLVARARSGASDSHVEAPGQLTLFEGTADCDDCGAEFQLDSSPNPYLCWQCDEHRGEAAGTGWFR